MHLSEALLHCKPNCSIGRTITIIILILRVPIRTAADDIHKYFFHCFLKKIRLDVSSESSARQRIHMKNQAFFLQKIKVTN